MKYHHIIELVAFIVGVVLVRKQWPLSAKLLVLLAGITFAVEIVSQWLWDTYQYNNNWIYNLFLPFQCLIILFSLEHLLMHVKIKKAIQFILVICVLGTVLSYIYFPHFRILNHYSSTLYLVLLIIASGLFFIDISINDVTKQLIQQPTFWLSTGVLVFCSIFVIRMAIWNYLNSLPDFGSIFIITNIIGNTFLYGGLIAFFLCLHLTKNFSLSSS